ASHAIGLTDTASVGKAILDRLFMDREKNTVKISIKKLLQEIVKSSKTLSVASNEGLGFLYVKACFAFQAQENNPLLKIWENAIAGMAEADKNGMIKSSLIGSLMWTLKPQIITLFAKDPKQRRLVAKSIKRELIERLHLQFDPVIGN